MNIESLKMFCDLADSQSFTKAAQTNGVTQSAVSQQVTSLEKTFKSLLIERSKKQFRLTREGQVLYDYSKQITRIDELLRSKMRELKDLISGNIQVATIYSIGLHELPPYITKFMKNHPTVNVRVEYRGSRQVYEDVLSNTVDLGLVAYPVKNPNLEIVPFGKDRLVIICHPHHPFAKKTSIKLKELTGQEMVSFESDIPTRKAIDKILNQYKVVVKYVMEFDNIETLKRAVEIGAGISIVPQATVNEQIAQKTLAAVEIENGQFIRPIAAIYKKSRVLTPAMNEFLTTLKSAA
ncbi:MAG: LysR family transcriptional regulator [Verrucomicrobiota bacterium]